MSAILRSVNPLGKKIQSNYMAGIRFGGGGGGRPGGKPGRRICALFIIHEMLILCLKFTP